MSGTLQLPKPTWFVGCGNMGSAIIDGWRTGGVDLGPITVIRPSAMPVEGTRTIAGLADAGPPPKLVVLAFKPQRLDEKLHKLEVRLKPSGYLVRARKSYIADPGR